MSLDFARSEFLRISKLVSENNLDGTLLKDQKSIRLLIEANNHKGINFLKIFSYSLISILVIIVCIDYEIPVTKRWLTFKYMEYCDEDPEQALCIIDNNDFAFLDELLRPPVPCDICKGLKEIKRVSDITAAEFEEKYAYSGVPVIVTDATKSWNASKVFSLSFFKSIYPADSPVIDTSIDRQGCQFFKYKTNFSGLAEVFQLDENDSSMEPWYVGWSNCDPDVANILRNYYDRPYFLPPYAESSKLDWIFMGTPKYGAPLHIDYVDRPSWQAQITGTKRWRLEPSPECYHICEPFIEGIVHTGEIIVVDTNIWYHSTLIEGSEISITIGSEYD